MKLNILVMHMLGAHGTRKTSFDHALCFERYAPQHNYVYVGIHDPITHALRRIRFHAVLLDTTALCIRYYRPRELFFETKQRWAFLAGMDAVKVAFPQDDYDHSQVLDGWLADLKVDLIYSVVHEHRSLLYPRSRTRADILPALTGYVNDADIAGSARFSKPYEQRSRLMGYRARNLPPQFGSYGQLKPRISEKFEEWARQRNLQVDVSTKPEETLLGDDWLRFLGDCKLVAGSEGGSSIWDPRGDIRDGVEAYLRSFPDAGFEEVEKACFPGLDRQVVFSAISPRLFEAAMLRCGQVLVEAPYLGVLRKGEHYIGLAERLDNPDEVFAQMSDEAKVKRMIDSCYDALIAPPTYRYSNHVRQVLERIGALAAQRRVAGTEDRRFQVLKKKHEAEATRGASAETRLRAVRSGTAKLLPPGVTRVLKRLLSA